MSETKATENRQINENFLNRNSASRISASRNYLYELTRPVTTILKIKTVTKAEHTHGRERQVNFTVKIKQQSNQNCTDTNNQQTETNLIFKIQRKQTKRTKIVSENNEII